MLKYFYVHASRWFNKPKHVALLYLIKLSSTKTNVYTHIFLLFIRQREGGEFHEHSSLLGS
jgi:hypothetical protein